MSIQNFMREGKDYDMLDILEEPLNKTLGEELDNALNTARQSQRKLLRSFNRNMRMIKTGLEERLEYLRTAESFPEVTPDYSRASLQAIRKIIRHKNGITNLGIPPIEELIQGVLKEFGIEPYRRMQERTGLAIDVNTGDTNIEGLNIADMMFDFDSDIQILLGIEDKEAELTKLKEKYGAEAARIQEEAAKKVPWINRLLARNRRIYTLIDSYAGETVLDYFDLVNMPDMQRDMAMQKANDSTIKKMQEAGIKLEQYFAGIPQQYFDMETATAGKETLFSRALEEITTATQNIPGVVYSPRSFLRKVYAATNIPPQHAAHIADELEYILGEAAKDEGTLIAYANAAADFIAKSSNVRSTEEASVHGFHLLSGRRILRGEQAGKGNDLFSIRQSRKDLAQDVSLGWESGCCLVEERIIPHLLDAATQFTEIYKGSTRVGMAMVFAAVHGTEKPVLAINSIEMSDIMRRYSDAALGRIVDETLAYIIDYAKAAGFGRVLMGAHSYNTAYNYGRIAKGKPKQGNYQAMKIGPPLFSDIIGINQTGMFSDTPKDSMIRYCTVIY